MSANQLLSTPITYRLPWSRLGERNYICGAEVDATHYCDGKPDKWAIREGGAVLNRAGKWEIEPIPSSRDDSFLARTRFDSAEEAALFAEVWFANNGASN